MTLDFRDLERARSPCIARRAPADRSSGYCAV